MLPTRKTRIIALSKKTPVFLLFAAFLLPGMSGVAGVAFGEEKKGEGIENLLKNFSVSLNATLVDVLEPGAATRQSRFGAGGQLEYQYKFNASSAITGFMGLHTDLSRSYNSFGLGYRYFWKEKFVGASAGLHSINSSENTKNGVGYGFEIGKTLPKGRFVSIRFMRANLPEETISNGNVKMFGVAFGTSFGGKSGSASQKPDVNITKELKDTSTSIKKGVKKTKKVLKKGVKSTAEELRNFRKKFMKKLE